MNRIDQKFKILREQNRRAFMPYLCAGDPTPELSEKLLLALEEAGADLIELGVPFSDLDSRWSYDPTGQRTCSQTSHLTATNT